MEIYLVRHGIAEESSDSGSDFDRKLTELGRQKVQSVARAFRKRVNRVDAILHSPLLRAEATAEIFSKEFTVEKEMQSGLQPMDRPEEVLRALREAGYERVVLVGHEPNLSHLAAQLIGVSNQPIFGFKKAGIAGIEWNGRVGELLFLLPPKFLI